MKLKKKKKIHQFSYGLISYASSFVVSFSVVYVPCQLIFFHLNLLRKCAMTNPSLWLKCVVKCNLRGESALAKIAKHGMILSIVGVILHKWDWWGRESCGALVLVLRLFLYSIAVEAWAINRFNVWVTFWWTSGPTGTKVLVFLLFSVNYVIFVVSEH